MATYANGEVLKAVEVLAFNYGSVNNGATTVVTVPSNEFWEIHLAAQSNTFGIYTFGIQYSGLSGGGIGGSTTPALIGPGGSIVLFNSDPIPGPAFSFRIFAKKFAKPA